MARESFEDVVREYPYEEEFKELIESISRFETRVNAKNAVEVERFELGYGWQAILYEEDSGFMRSLEKKLTDLNAGSTNYRSRPDYEWELKAPDAEAYRRRGLDASPEKFKDILEDFLG